MNTVPGYRPKPPVVSGPTPPNASGSALGPSGHGGRARGSDSESAPSYSLEECSGTGGE